MAGSAARTDEDVTTGRADPAPTGRSRLVRALRPSSGGDARGRWVVAVLALVVVALAVLGIVQALSIRSHDDLADRRRAAVDAASNEVSALLTVSAKSSSANLKTLLAGATAGFHDQLEQQAKTFTQALAQGKVTSTGSVASVGLVSMNGARTSAVVAVAAKASVKNASSPNGDERNYRLTVNVKRVGGRWLVSGLRFVV